MDADPPDIGCKPTDLSGRIGDDLLLGYSQVAAELGLSRRATLHLLEAKLIPAGRLGGRYVVSKRRLKEHFEALVAGGREKGR